MAFVRHAIDLRAATILCSVALALITLVSSAHAQGTRLPWSSDFDSGTFDAWDGFRNTNGVTIETNGCQSGRCARAPLLAGTVNDNYGDFHFGDHVSVKGPKLEAVWLSFYSKFDAGLIWPNRSQKLAILNLTDGATTTRHYQVYVYVRPNGEYAVDKSDLDDWVFSGLYQNVGGAASAVRFGQWDKLKLYVKLNTPGRADGIVKLWVNGVLKVDYGSVDIREGAAFGLNKLNLSSSSTQAGVNSGVQWWDSFELQTTDPDAVSAVPNPPADVRVF